MGHLLLTAPGFQQHQQNPQYREGTKATTNSIIQIVSICFSRSFVFALIFLI